MFLQDVGAVVLACPDFFQIRSTAQETFRAAETVTQKTSPEKTTRYCNPEKIRAATKCRAPRLKSVQFLIWLKKVGQNGFSLLIPWIMTAAAASTNMEGWPWPVAKGAQRWPGQVWPWAAI